MIYMKLNLPLFYEMRHVTEKIRCADQYQPGKKSTVHKQFLACATSSNPVKLIYLFLITCEI